MESNPLHAQIKTNPRGRDFVVGDLHGCFSALTACLREVGFRTATDRLFSVGDLIDRGGDSRSCLRLIEEPWFHSVMGNHERLMLDCVMGNSIDGESDRRWSLLGGGWYHNLDRPERVELERSVLPLVRDLPYVITVGGGSSRFHVAHAELTRADTSSSAAATVISNVDVPPVMTDEEVAGHWSAVNAGSILSGRSLIRSARDVYVSRSRNAEGGLIASAQRWSPGLSLTFVGHTPLRTMVLHRSHLFIDGGPLVFRKRGRLHLLDVNEVRRWIDRLD